MVKRYVHNDTGAPIFVGGVMIDHNQGREVDVPEHATPAEGQPAAEEPPPPDDEAARRAQLEQNLRDLLAGNSKSVLAALPDASDDTLAALTRLEGEREQPRKGVLAAIAELQLQRAQARAGGAPT